MTVSTTTSGPSSPPPASSPYRFLAQLLVFGGIGVIVGTVLTTLGLPWEWVAVGVGMIVLGITMNVYLGSPPEVLEDE